MAKKAPKSKASNEKPLRNSKINKPSLKVKLKLKMKNAKAQIEKLNQDMTRIIDIHSELVLNAETKNELNALDAKNLRADLERDENIKKESKKAELDLAKQLEIITGMSL